MSLLIKLTFDWFNCTKTFIDRRPLEGDWKMPRMQDRECFQVEKTQLDWAASHVVLLRRLQRSASPTREGRRTNRDCVARFLPSPVLLRLWLSVWLQWIHRKFDYLMLSSGALVAYVGAQSPPVPLWASSSYQHLHRSFTSPSGSGSQEGQKGQRIVSKNLIPPLIVPRGEEVEEIFTLCGETWGYGLRI